MILITFLTLENEMDLVLAYRKSILVAAECKHTLATQTTFATAVSEIARSLIDKTNSGKVSFYIDQKDAKFSVIALMEFSKDTEMDTSDSGYRYACKLVPEVSFETNEVFKSILLRLSIPASSRMTTQQVQAMQSKFKEMMPLTPYEEVKNRNQELYLQAIENAENLQESQSLNARKDEFIAMAGHELKTPLTLIRAFSDLHKKMQEGQERTPAGELVEKIAFQAKKMQMLTEQLLDVTNVSLGTFRYNKEYVPVDEFLQGVCDIGLSLLPDHTFIYKVEVDHTPVYMDALRMEQVLHNLLLNAGKYSEKGSEITLLATQTPQGITISVTDQGIGISPEHQARIFDKFYRIDAISRNYSGLGMGLFIASNIIQAHGATLGVSSEQGVGSRFYFTLAAAEKDAQAAG